MINRAKLRGKPLDEDCKTANTTTGEFGIHDDRVFCYGLYGWGADKCRECKAYVENAEPLKVDSTKDGDES